MYHKRWWSYSSIGGRTIQLGIDKQAEKEENLQCPYDVTVFLLSYF